MSQALWRCPACGQTFVSRNMPHSCQVVGLDAFFAGAAPALRDLFDRFVAAARASGAVTVNATKSRVALQVRMRFAGIDRPRKAHLVANFVLTRPLASPRLMRVEALAPYYYVHRLRLREPADVDAELAGWLAEAYQVGDQRHLTDPGWPRVPV
jgi:ABC-type antimicrobial peptide transport system permease subunit